MQILCFGDSNTFGYDPRGFFGDRYDAKDRWVDLLAAVTGHTIVNAGANGMEIPRSCNPLRIFDTYANADMFIIMLGTNDLLQGSSANEAAQRMEAFLRRLLPYRKAILLVSPPPMQRGVWVPSDALVTESCCLANEYEKVAKKLGVAFADTSGWKIPLAFDGVHFTEEGHHTFAQHLLQYI